MSLAGTGFFQEEGAVPAVGGVPIILTERRSMNGSETLP